MAGAEEEYRFDLEDPAWPTFLKDEGYAVIKAAATPAEVAEAKTLLWKDIEALWRGTKRHDPETWCEFRVPLTGIAPELAQSAGAWAVRGNPRVQAAFGKIWGTADLITSMDCVICWKPWWGEHHSYEPRTEGLHLDQSPFSKPDFDCVQGMLPLVAVTEEVGGLQVVPRSHTDAAKADWKLRYPHRARSGDWCPLDHDDPDYRRTRFLRADAGDLVLWDSRTVHGGVVGPGGGDLKGSRPSSAPSAPAYIPPHKRAEAAAADNALATSSPETASGGGGDSASAKAAPASTCDGAAACEAGAAVGGADLARMSVTVAMVPRSRATEKVQQLRVQGFEEGKSFNHSPHEAGTSAGTFRTPKRKGHVAIALNDSQRAVL